MEKKNEVLEVKEGSEKRLESKLLVTRKKPTFGRVEPSSVLGRVKAFMPQIEKGQIDLWREMKQKGDESVDVEKVEKDQAPMEMEFAIVPSEVIISSDDETSDESDMDDDERRIFDLINLKLNGTPVDADSGISNESTETERKLIETITESME